MKPAPVPDEERDYVHWNRVYAAVISFLAILIIALWLFSQAYR